MQFSGGGDGIPQAKNTETTTRRNDARIDIGQALRSSWTWAETNTVDADNEFSTTATTAAADDSMKNNNNFVIIDRGSVAAQQLNLNIPMVSLENERAIGARHPTGHASSSPQPSNHDDGGIMTLFQYVSFSGRSLRVLEPMHWFMWAEQLPVCIRHPTMMRNGNDDDDGVDDGSGGGGGGKGADSSSFILAPKQLYFQSMSVCEPSVVSLVAWFCDWQRVFFMPLTLDRPEADLDARVRTSIEYASVSNPYGSGAYTHWSNHHIIYYIAFHNSNSSRNNGRG